MTRTSRRPRPVLPSVLLLVVGPLVVALLTTACGGYGEAAARGGPVVDTGEDTGEQIGEQIGEGVVVTVAFHDSSVPPPHHESWTVTLAAGTRTRTTDSYGEVLDSVTEPVPAAAWTAYVEALPQRLAEIGTESRGEPCPGGTSTELVVTGAGAADRRVLVHPGCGGDEAEAADLAAVVDLVEGLAEV